MLVCKIVHFEIFECETDIYILNHIFTLISILWRQHGFLEKHTRLGIKKSEFWS